MIDRFFLEMDNIGMRLRDLGFIIYRPGYFHETPPEKKVEKFKNILAGTKSTVKIVSKSEWNVLTSYSSKTRVSKVFLHNSYDKNKPSIIFHHGAGQFSYSGLIKRGLGKSILEKNNVFSIKAEHHENMHDYLSNCMNSFLNWQLTFAGSVNAMEHIVKFHKKESKKQIIAMGVSMGGIVSTLHFLFFNTADIYLPFVAYPNVGKIFLGKAYRFAVDSLPERLKNKSYFDSFDFDNKYSIKNRKKVFPILARYDWYIDFGKAQEFWKGYEIIAYNLGHKSIAVKINDIKRHIEKRIKP